MLGRSWVCGEEEEGPHLLHLLPNKEAAFFGGGTFTLGRKVAISCGAKRHLENCRFGAFPPQGREDIFFLLSQKALYKLLSVTVLHFSMLVISLQCCNTASKV